MLDKRLREKLETTLEDNKIFRNGGSTQDNIYKTTGRKLIRKGR